MIKVRQSKTEMTEEKKEQWMKYGTSFDEHIGLTFLQKQSLP